MKRCPTCNALYQSTSAACTDCGYAPVYVNGFPSYAPDLIEQGVGFKSDYFAELASLEEASFWFKFRNELIVWALRKYCAGFQSFLEVGCGTGFVLSGINKAFPEATLHGSEIFAAGLGYAATRLPFVGLMQMDARDIPFHEEFDVIGAFDVLEHIKEDEGVLSQTRDALKPHGHLVITVPQHKWLWSSTDDYACHVRRYDSLEIQRKIEAAGFSIIRSTSFVTILLPAMAMSRMRRKKKNGNNSEARAELKMSPFLNTQFLHLLNIELKLISRGLDLPVGGSRLVVARKI